MRTSRCVASLAVAGAVALGCVAPAAPLPAPVVEVVAPRPPRAERHTEPVPASEEAGAHASQGEPRGGWRTVEGRGFRYEVPVEWEELDASALGSPLISHAQRSRTPVGSFAQNVNVASEPFTGDSPAYANAHLFELQKVSTVRRLDGARSGPSHGWDIEAVWPNPGAAPYVTLQRYATNGTHGFVLTCSTGEAVFAEHRGTCDRILDSFRVE